MGASLTFDHLVVSAESLDAGVAKLEAQLGVSFEAGGKHARYGTHNALLGLDDGLYLEVIAIDPDAQPEIRPRWFGLDVFSGVPTLTNWVCRAEGLSTEALPAGFDKVVDLQRGDLHWRMAEATGGALPFDQCHPGLIDWGDTPPPPTRLKPCGLTLKSLELQHPEALALNNALKGLEDDRVSVRATCGSYGLRAVLSDRNGREITLCR